VPQAGGDRVAAIDPDLAAFKVLRGADAELGVVEDRAVVEGAHQEHRQRREPLAMGAGAHIGRDRQLADVELEPPHHAPERIDQDRDLNEIEGKVFRLHSAVLEGLIVALCAGDGLERGLGHGDTSRFS
jgi:hypothetical protein